MPPNQTAMAGSSNYSVNPNAQLRQCQNMLAQTSYVTMGFVEKHVDTIRDTAKEIATMKDSYREQEKRRLDYEDFVAGKNSNSITAALEKLQRLWPLRRAKPQLIALPQRLASCS